MRSIEWGLSYGFGVPDGEGREGEGVGAVDEDLGGTAPYSAPEVLLGKDLDVFCAPETLRLSVHHR